MNSKFYLITAIFLSVILFSFFSSPPDGRTGAPGESTCASCHGGGNPLGLDGDIEIDGLDPLITPGATYTVTVRLTNPNGLAERAGFQIVALDENDDNIGELSNPSPSSTISSQLGRTYFKHNPGLNFPVDNEVEWTVDWTAPAMPNSSTVTFYGAGNIADGNGASSNDFIVTTVLELDFEPMVDPLEIMIISSTDVSCFGGFDGTAEAEASGGEGSYTFSWSNGESGPIATQLNAGIHEVTVTDDAGSSASTTVEISEPDQIEIQLSNQINVSCFAAADGSISVSASGGTGQFSFNWSNGESGESIFNLSSGNYSVTVTDENSCTATASYFVSEPDPIFINEFKQDVSCHGEEDGEISLIIDGGTPPYQVNWSSGDFGVSLSDLAAGDYFYTLTDANDCEEVGAITIEEPDDIVLTTSFVNPSCPGCEDGSATVVAEGGVGGFSYSWDTDPPQNTATADNLGGGTYTVVVTDGNGCQRTAMVSLIEPEDCITSGGFYFNQNPVHCTVESLENLCFDLPESTHQDSLSICDANIEITNPLWYNFTAGDSLFHILAEIDDCSNEDGVRVALFELPCAIIFDQNAQGLLPDEQELLTSCDWLLNPQSGEIEIEVDVVPGRVYGLMVDGYEGDRCRFEVTEVLSADDAPELDSFNLEEIFIDYVLNDTICIGAQGVEFSYHGSIEGACTYIWTLEDHSDGSIVEIERTTAGEIPIILDFPEEGEFSVCVQASNQCSSSELNCISFPVVPLEDFQFMDTICLRQDYTWVDAFGEVIGTIPGFDVPGEYQFDTISVNAFMCEVETILNLYVIPDNIDDKTLISAVICSGDGFQMPDGQIFTQTGFYGEDNSIFITQASDPGATYQCDSFFTLDLIVLDLEVFWDEPVCIDNEIFIIPDQNVSPNPWIQPGFGEEEISWKWIRVNPFADPDTIESGDFLVPNDSLNGIVIDIEEWFNERVEIFEWHVQMTFDGEPEEACRYIAGFFRFDLNDLKPNLLNVQGDTIAEVDTAISFEITNAPQDSIPIIIYHWEVNADSGDYTIINGNPGSVLDIVFHSIGEYEICVTATNECGEGDPNCFTVVIDMDVSAGELLNEQKEVNVFPNPVEEYLIIQSKDLKGEIDITIFDSAGKLVKFNSIQHDQQSHLDVSGLSAGIYFIRIHQGGEVFKEQFVKK